MAQDIYAISMTGMAIERAKIEAATQNIANMNTISSNSDHVYKTKSVISEININNFNDYLQNNGSIIEQVSNFKSVYKPEHSQADNKGFIYMPDVNIASEMLLLNSATRAYEANVRAFNAYKSMSAKSLEIGK